MRISRPLALTAGLVMAAAGSAQAAVIENGTFDIVVPSNATGGGWTSSNIDGAGGWRTTAPGVGVNDFINFFIINDAGQAGSDPTLQQQLTGLVVGETYRITGQYERAYPTFGADAAPSFGVEIVELGLLAAFSSPAGGGAGDFAIEFTATATEHLLRLTAERNGDDSSYAVDNIGITTLAAVPEPESVALLGLGLLALGLLRRRLTEGCAD